MDEDYVDDQTMQLGGKSRLCSKGRDFAQDLQKSVLSQLLSYCGITGHP